jgi:3-oxoadipyl-CoA thiolase
MAEAFICDGLRTPIGRYGGALAKVRADDLATVPIKALMARYPKADWSRLDEVYLGCANQAGEDNRNVARMALLLAGLPDTIPGVTVNRLCASGLNAVGVAAQAIRAGENEFAIAGGVESMTRAPFVMGKAGSLRARPRSMTPRSAGALSIRAKQQYGVDQMADTAENVAEEMQIARKDQDALRCARGARRQGDGFFEAEIAPVEVPGWARRPGRGGEGRAPAPRHDARGAGQASAVRAHARHGHGRQCVRRQRRRRRAHHSLGTGREGAWPYPQARILGMAAAGVPPASWASARCPPPS